MEGCEAMSSRVYSTGLAKNSVGDVALWKEGAQLAMGEVHLHYSVDGVVASIVCVYAAHAWHAYGTGLDDVEPS